MTRKGRFFAIFGAFFIVALIFTAWACSGRIDAARSRVDENWRKIQQTETDRLSRMVSAWKADLFREMRMVSVSDTFRMLLSDLSALDAERLAMFLKKDAGGDEETASLIEQAEYAANLLSETTEKSKFSDARLLSPAGAVLLSGSILPPPSGERLTLAGRAVEERGPVFGSIYEEHGALYIDSAEPLFGMDGKKSPDIAGVFLASIPLDDELVHLLAPRKDISFAIADRASGFVVALSGRHPVFAKTIDILDESALPFSRRIDIVDDQPCYSSGVRINHPEWTIVAQTPAGVVDGAFNEERIGIWFLGCAIAFCAAFLCAAIWFFISRGEHIRKNAALERKNQIIGEQRDLLDGMNQALSAGLALADKNGIVKAGNRAFAEMSGKRNLVGMHLREALPAETWSAMAQAFGRAEERAEETEAPFGSRLLRVGVFPASAGNRSLVFQDITEHRQRALLKASRQKALIRAMEQAIESIDPDLSGHSAKLRELAGKMGKEAGFDADSLEAMEIAASLSQIGKLFTPREILLKEGKLSDDERALVADGMKKGAGLLGSMDFGLPVPEIVAQMNSKNPIMREAVLLALANSFIALTSRRKWREKPLDANAAVDTLANDGRFSGADIEILEKAVR